MIKLQEDENARSLKTALHSIIGDHLGTERAAEENGRASGECFLVDFSTSYSHSLEVHLRQRRPRPVLAIHIESATRPKDGETMLRAYMTTPGLMEICLFDAGAWTATVWRRLRSQWDMRDTWLARAPRSGVPHPLWHSERVTTDDDLILDTIDFRIPITRLMHITGLTAGWQRSC